MFSFVQKTADSHRLHRFIYFLDCFLRDVILLSFLDKELNKVFSIDESIFDLKILDKEIDISLYQFRVVVC